MNNYNIELSVENLNTGQHSGWRTFIWRNGDGESVLYGYATREEAIADMNRLSESVTSKMIFPGFCLSMRIYEVSG